MNQPPPPPPVEPPSNPPGLPPAPRPFAAEPKPVPGGCSRPLLVGCGVLIVLIGIAGIVFVAKAKDLLAWTMREVQKQVMVALPGDLTADERSRLDRGFDAAIAKMQKGEVETPALYALQSQLMNAAEKAQKKTMTREDVLDLLSALERVGGLLPKEDDSGGPANSGESVPAPGSNPAGPPAPSPQSPP